MSDEVTKFGRYIVLDELVADDGERTRVAFDPQLDRKVGLKVFSVASSQARARRRDRARVLAGLVHPHVVRVHDVGEVDGQPFAAVDFVEGSTLGPWLEQHAPSWSRVLEVFLAAGEGLAAAHAAGLAHGRFGFDAMVVGDDQQVRVIDLLRTSPWMGPPPRPEDDRRAWVAALYEALGGRTGEAEPLARTRVPRRVRRILLAELRGRSPHRSLAELVATLRSARHRRRRLGAAAAGLVVAAGLSAAVLARPAPAPAARSWCDQAGPRLDAIWNEASIERGRQAFLATGVPHAAEAWRAVEDIIEPFVGQWRLTQALRCSPDEDDDPSRRAAATVCLHRQMRALETFLDDLQSADAATVFSATQAAASLGNPTTCGAEADGEIRYADVDLQQVLEIESALSQAKMHRTMSRFDEALAQTEQAREQARRLGLRALVGEADYDLALTHRVQGREDEAEQGLHAAFDAAVASDHPEIVARSAMELAMLMAEQGRHDEARRWAEHAAAAVEHHDTLPLRTRLANAQGLTAYRRGDNEEARTHYERSIALANQQDPPDDFARIAASQALGNVLGRQGHHAAQIETLEESLAFARAHYPMHPTIGHHLNSLGVALSHRGSVDLALESHREAVEIFERTFGLDHPDTIAASNSQAAALHEAGRDEEAARAYERVLAAAARTFTDQDPRYVNVLGSMGMFHAMTKDYEQAASLLTQAATLNETIHGPAHMHTLGYLNNLAAVHMFSGQLEPARIAYEDILARTERSLGADHPQVVPALLGLARVLHELDRPAEAVPQLERALTLSLTREVRPERLGTVRFDLARARWDARLDRPRALELARAAAQNFVVAKEEGWDIGERIVEIQQWLTERGAG